MPQVYISKKQYDTLLKLGKEPSIFIREAIDAAMNETSHVKPVAHKIENPKMGR